ncbi:MULTISPECIES: branched-chain amino acid ABC transporter permease [unclassified Beijerinckia]|uniref:branched-chain amino acid ABC transporter permease n=1 Tax=unclassified Beijerinckia TaxID=2638183 RepID=UPI000899CEC9|nr:MULTISPECIES: branched-chain amino acid ABC transporter permease [unclassified Beijerinckia]MDH7795962.1 branched-chain amino acid transport system permease protein [Beijerinckia sp. GAS462]SEC23998.1 amino acid/amide ABC transporter membrane protein 2, HAAT family [Beijerinckia sp. 28-YEA-48]
MAEIHNPALNTALAKPKNVRSRLLIAQLIVLLAVLPYLATLIGQPALVSLATRIIILAIAAASLNLIMGYAGLASFGHAAWYGLGGYVVGILYRHSVTGDPLFGLTLGTDQMLISVPVAILIAGLFAAIFGALSLRTSGVQFIMITLAFAQMIFFFFVALKAYGGDDGLIIRRRNALPGLDTRDPMIWYWICLVVAILWYALLSRIVASRFGRILVGVRQSERRMAAMGVRTYRYKLVAFVIAGMGGGLAGALMANHMRYVSPDMLHWTQSGEFMFMVILGGAGTLLGPAFGAAVLIGLETVLAAWTEHWQVILGPILVLAILFTRGGLSGLVRMLRGSRDG